MRKRLDDAGLLTAYRESGQGTEVELLAEFLASLQDAPWAPKTTVATSEGRLTFTTTRSRDSGQQRGTVQLAAQDGRIDVGLCPPDTDRPTEQSSCSLVHARNLVSIWMQKILKDFRLHPHDGAGEDANATYPSFLLHHRVRVMARKGRNTPRQGEIRRVTWHHKHGRWNYYLREGSRSVTKRYYSTDLELDDSGSDT